MVIHAASWGSYELDDSWTDETAHVLRRAGGDDSTETLVVHRDPAGAGMTADQYARQQQALLAEKLPGFALQRASGRRVDGRDAQELAFTWTAPAGPIEQVQVQVPGRDGMVLFTATGVPRLTPQGHATFLRMLASARIPSTPPGP